jgi:hypothetical protein
MGRSIVGLHRECTPVTTQHHHTQQQNIIIHSNRTSRYSATPHHHTEQHRIIIHNNTTSSYTTVITQHHLRAHEQANILHTSVHTSMHTSVHGIYKLACLSYTHSRTRARPPSPPPTLPSGQHDNTGSIPRSHPKVRYLRCLQQNRGLFFPFSFLSLSFQDLTLKFGS